MDTRWLLTVPYALNCLILVPVCIAMFAGAGPTQVFEGRVAASRGLELLVASLWLAILLASVVGLFAPRAMAPLLAVQVIYKATWLAVFVAPLAMRGEAVPWGIAGCFVFIVAVWPIFLWLAWRPV